jgi:hypothetical protein
MPAQWFTVKFPESEGLDWIEEAVATKFGGLAAAAYRGNEERIIYLRALENDKDLLRKQLKALMDDGVLSFEERA